MNEASELSVKEQREQFLLALRAKVKLAYKSRYYGDIDDKDEITNREEFGKFVECRKPDELIDFGKNKDLDYQVTVSNPHDYRELLILAYETIFEETGGVFDMKKPEHKKRIEDTLTHEYGHAVPILGEKGAKIRYGIEFSENAKKRELVLGAFTQINGRVTKQKYIEHLMNVPDPSERDLAVGKHIK